MRLRFNKYHRITDPFVHDGYLDCWWLEKDVHLDFKLRTLRDEIYVLSIQSPLKLRAERLRVGNCILDIGIQRGGDCRLDDLAYVYEADTDEERRADWFQAKHKQVLEENLVLVVVTPSYGCFLVALGRDYEMLPQTRQGTPEE